MKSSRTMTPMRVIVLIDSLLLIGIALQAVSLVLSNGAFLNNMVYDLGYFPDYFGHIGRFYAGVPSVYMTDHDACFPPLAYGFYYFIARALWSFNIADPQGLSTNSAAILVLCMRIALFTVMFTNAFRCLYREAKTEVGSIKLQSYIMPVLLIVSYPFWLAIERGNLTIWVLVLLMFALSFRDSKHAVLREAALILIAIAAGLKLYPAIFGVLYITDKRWKEGARLAIYGLLFFLVPFAFFGGAEGFTLWYHNISIVALGTTGITIAGIIGRVFAATGMELARGNQIGKIVADIYFVLVVGSVLIVEGFKKRKNGIRWQSVALLTSLMIVFVQSGSYCLLFWTIPFILYLNELNQKLEKAECCRTKDILYGVLFSLAFMAYPLEKVGSSGVLYGVLYLQVVFILGDQLNAILKQ